MNAAENFGESIVKGSDDYNRRANGTVWIGSGPYGLIDHDAVTASTLR